MIEGTLNLATSKSQEKGAAGPVKQKCGGRGCPPPILCSCPREGLAVEHAQVRVPEGWPAHQCGITRQQVSPLSSGERGN